MTHGALNVGKRSMAARVRQHGLRDYTLSTSLGLRHQVPPPPVPLRYYHILAFTTILLPFEHPTENTICHIFYFAS